MTKEIAATITESRVAIKERIARITADLRVRFPDCTLNANAMKEHRLASYELFWRDHYLWLEDKGYRLRPRYHPDWVASWKDSDTDYDLCEDGQEILVSYLFLLLSRHHSRDRRALL